MSTQISPGTEKLKQILLNDPADQQDSLDIVEYWRSITKRKFAILGFGLVVALLAAAIVFTMTPIYRSTMTILIEADKSKVLAIEDVYSGISQKREYFQTQVEILKSRQVALNTIRKLKLWEREEFDPRLKDDSLKASLLSRIGFADKTVKEWNEDTLAEAAYGRFPQKLTIEPVRLSQLAKISFESKDPELAALVVNALAEVYIKNDLDERYKVTKQANSWLQDQLASLKTKLDDSERGLQNYREKEGIVDIKNSAQSGAGKQIEEVTQRLVETRMKRAEAENAYDQIKTAPKGADLSSLPAVIRNQIVADAKKQELEAERRLSETAQRYGAEHPKYMQAEGELKTAKDNTRRQVENVVQSVTREYETARGTEKALEGIMASARGSVQTINRKEFELNVLEREVDANRQMYDMFMKRAKETNVSGDLQSAVARVIDAAVVSAGPVKPQKVQVTMIAFVLGLFIGVLSALLRDRLDNTLKTTEDVENKLKHPLLTTLPLLGRGEIKPTSTARLFLDQPQSLYAEAIRTARTGVMLSAIDEPKRLLVVTSSLPGEGKTTFSINLAMAHAPTMKTLLIDADMRRPAVSKNLALTHGAKGLSNLVSGTATLKECVQRIDGSNLTVMPSGTIPPNPLDLLLSKRFKETLAQLSEIFDVIVIDSPPVELVSDALVISSMTTGVIYVTKALNTPYPLIKKGLKRISRADGHILGVVLNQFDFSKAEKYYGEYSGYGKYGYGAKGSGGSKLAYGQESAT